MKLISYTVDLSFTNAPRVDARVLIPDPVTGEAKAETLHFVDDDARDLVEMISNPNGTGLVANPDGRVDTTKMRAKAEARIAEAGEVPETIAARVAAAEEARRVQHAAQAAAKAATEAAETAEAQRAAADAERARLALESAQLDAEIAKKRAELASAEPAAEPTAA